jgi:hypothetical protein
MTALERLLAEAVPTGTFGDAQPAPARSTEPRRWTPAEQAAHLRELAEGIDGWEYAKRTRRPHTTRHLYVIDAA